jgi:tripartite-type tricarboxylate transporter receptor subunit TctC
MRRLASVALLLLALAGGAAFAQDYPSRPVRLVVPFPPGGSNDIVARMVASQLGERMGQQFFIDNRGGAGGTIGAETVAKAPPDGYTLLLISVAFAFNTSLYKNLPYDPAKVFAPVGALGTGPVALTVYPGLPVKTTAELIALARQKPGQLNYASAGVGSFQHLAAALFCMQAGVDIVHVPYKGGGPATMDVIMGHAQVSIGSLIQQLPHIRSGGVKALATSGPKRSPLLPDVPTIGETLPGYEASNWWGLLVRAGTPRDIVDRLARELAAVLGSDETKKRFAAEGAEPMIMAPDEFGRFIAAETSKWARVVRESGITPD